MTNYRKWEVLASFGGGMSRWFEVVAIDVESALADLTEAYGEFRMVTYRAR